MALGYMEIGVVKVVDQKDLDILRSKGTEIAWTW
jgi:hypothetical protein